MCGALLTHRCDPCFADAFFDGKGIQIDESEDEDEEEEEEAAEEGAAAAAAAAVKEEGEAGAEELDDAAVVAARAPKEGAAAAAAFAAARAAAIAAAEAAVDALGSEDSAEGAAGQGEEENVGSAVPGRDARSASSFPDMKEVEGQAEGGSAAKKRRTDDAE